MFKISCLARGIRIACAALFSAIATTFPVRVLAGADLTGITKLGTDFWTFLSEQLGGLLSAVPVLTVILVIIVILWHAWEVKRDRKNWGDIIAIGGGGLLFLGLVTILNLAAIGYNTQVGGGGD